MPAQNNHRNSIKARAEDVLRRKTARIISPYMLIFFLFDALMCVLLVLLMNNTKLKDDNKELEAMVTEQSIALATATAEKESSQVPPTFTQPPINVMKSSTPEMSAFPSPPSPTFTPLPPTLTPIPISPTPTWTLTPRPTRTPTPAPTPTPTLEPPTPEPPTQEIPPTRPVLPPPTPRDTTPASSP